MFRKGHEFDFNNKEILKKLRSKRTIKIHETNQLILKGNSTVNFRKDAAHVSPVFYNLIKKQWKTSPYKPSETTSEPNEPATDV